MRALLLAGAALELKTNSGVTALHLAARNGHDKIIEILLAKGADLSSSDKAGLSALHYAAAAGHVDCCALLLRGGANVWARTSDGLTPETAARGQGDEALARVIATYP
jgi:ankyrin repeat protein